MDNPQNKTPSPLEGVSSNRFQGKTYINESVVSLAGGRVTLLRNNPNRFFWIMINEGAVDVRVSTDANISTTSGWLLAASGGIVSMYWEEDGESVGYEVFAIPVAGAGSVRIREVVRS